MFSLLLKELVFDFYLLCTLSFCWFCREAAQLYYNVRYNKNVSLATLPAHETQHLKSSTHPFKCTEILSRDYSHSGLNLGLSDGGMFIGIHGKVKWHLEILPENQLCAFPRI